MGKAPSSLGTAALIGLTLLLMAAGLFVAVVPVKTCHTCAIVAAYHEELQRERQEVVDHHGKVLTVVNTPSNAPSPRPMISCDNCTRGKMTLLRYWLPSRQPRR